MIDIDRIRNDAEKGIDDAIIELGICYLTGSGIQKNRAEAVKLFRIAALKNNCDGMYNIAMCLLKGRGCNINEAEALEFLNKAAELNDIKSINFLGNFYSDKRDFEKAIKYFKSSSDLKDSWGMHRLAVLYMRDPDKRYEAKKMFFENYIILNDKPEEFVSVLKNYEMNNLFDIVLQTFKNNYLTNEGACALLTIPSFSTPYIWEIVKNNNDLRVKQTIWNKNKDEEIINNILTNESEKSDINLISRPFSIQPAIESSYLTTDSCVLRNIVNKLNEMTVPLYLKQDYYVICDGTMYQFKTWVPSPLELCWNTDISKRYEEFNDLISLLKCEIHKDPNAIME